ALEVNRLFALFGVGITALKYLAFGIMFISGISIFVALYNTLKERKYDFALLRITGGSKLQLLVLVILECVCLCVAGFVLVFISGISSFVVLYNTLKERKYEFALLRITGASKLQLLWLVLLESVFLCVAGFILGIIFGRIGLYFLSVSSQQEFKMAFNPFEFL